MKNEIKVNPQRISQIKRAIKSGGMLDIPKNLIKPGYKARWFSNENKNNIDNAKELGYIPILTSSGEAYEVYGGVGIRGVEFKLCAFQISPENKAEVDFVRMTEKEEKRDENINASVSSIKGEIFTKKGIGDINSLNNIKSL